MDGFERRREKKKEAIYQAAFELFAKYGIQKTSVEEIAKKANVSQVTIYNYFGSKDDLALKVIQTFTERTFDDYEKILESDQPFQEKLEQIITREMDISDRLSPDFIASISDGNPDIQTYYATFTEERGIPFMLRFINEGKEAGCIDPSLTEESVIFYIGMYYRELLRHPELYDNEEKKIQFTKDMLQLFFYGLMGKNSQ